MKILLIVNPVIAFPPVDIGGTERIVQYLMDELVNQGHEVTLLGHNDSVVPKGVRFIGIGTYLDNKKTTQKVWAHLVFNRYDVIHNHGRLIFFLPRLWGKVRKIHTFHMAELANRSFLSFLKLKAVNFTFAPCGKWIQEKYEHLGGHWNYVNNGLPENLYTCDNLKANTGSTLVTICRIGLTKGVLDAIEIAKRTGHKLLIAGRVGNYPHEKQWFIDNIAQYINGDQIRFIGTVNDAEKNIILNAAAALLIPTIDSEAFNTTMLEANACGCPVISYDKFCFKEFIADGVNGYKSGTIEGLVQAVSAIPKIDRAKCREIFESKYTSRIMTANYLKLYKSRI